VQKVTPFLWFKDQAEEAARFYVSLFKDARVTDVTPMSATFEIDGQQFIAFNGGPHYTLTPAISLFVNCETQGEVDELWEKFSEGGEKSRCGWLTDKYGLSWQIIPSVLGKRLQDKDPAKSKRVMAAMMQMGKIDIAAIEEAYAG
jgi:predicted 3-demethylubiquinone-9 3-methyltransferase (glyoxalase superfamily)